MYDKNLCIAHQPPILSKLEKMSSVCELNFYYLPFYGSNITFFGGTRADCHRKVIIWQFCSKTYLLYRVIPFFLCLSSVPDNLWFSGAKLEGTKVIWDCDKDEFLVVICTDGVIPWNSEQSSSRGWDGCSRCLVGLV